MCTTYVGCACAVLAPSMRLVNVNDPPKPRCLVHGEHMHIGFGTACNPLAPPLGVMAISLHVLHCEYPAMIMPESIAPRTKNLSQSDYGEGGPWEGLPIKHHVLPNLQSTGECALCNCYVLCAICDVLVLVPCDSVGRHAPIHTRAGCGRLLALWATFGLAGDFWPCGRF